MSVANAFNAESDVLCLHEGKIRVGEEEGDQVIPYLTLQNLAAYQRPGDAEELFRKARDEMPSARLDEAGQTSNLRLIGDIAYNYAPFVEILPQVFPDARIIFMFRDGRDFVRSVYTDESPDPTPVGWCEPRTMNRVERFIALGRLRPRSEDALSQDWESMSPVAKNAWLWSETNRLILDGLESHRWDSDRICRVRFEDFVTDPHRAYGRMRSFVGLDGETAPRVFETLDAPINARRRKLLPAWADWSREDRNDFRRFAGEVMGRLGYAMD